MGKQNTRSGFKDKDGGDTQATIHSRINDVSQDLANASNPDKQVQAPAGPTVLTANAVAEAEQAADVETGAAAAVAGRRWRL